MEVVNFNMNDYIKVKLTDEGIERIVTKINSFMPFKHQTSFKEYKERAEKDGYHKFQMHSFLDYFGGLGMSITDYVNLNIIVLPVNRT